MNADREARREAARRGLDQLYYELIHNLVLEATRTGIEVKNLKMRLESVSSRLEFNERRARALEGAVVYKSAEGGSTRCAASAGAGPAVPAANPAAAAILASDSAAGESRSRHRRHRRRQVLAPRKRRRQPTRQRPGSGPAVPGEGPGQRSRRRRRRRGRRGGGAAAAVIGAAGSTVPAAGQEPAPPRIRSSPTISMARMMARTLDPKVRRGRRRRAAHPRAPRRRLLRMRQGTTATI